MKSLMRMCVAAFGLVFLNACTFQPMYGDYADIGGGRSSSSLGAQLGAIDIAPIGGRTGLMLRNELIFILNGGGNQAANPYYRLDVILQSNTTQTQIEQVSGRPKTALLYVSATYVLVDTKTGRRVHEGRSFARSSFDKTVQRFANIRAERDSEDRALKTLAESMRNSLAAYFAQAAQGNAPEIAQPAPATPIASTYDARLLKN